MHNRYQKIIRQSIAGLICLLWTSFVVSATWAAPSSDLWPVWQAHDPESRATIDHSAWGEFLGRYLAVDSVSGVQLMRYATVTAADREKLDQYLTRLQSVAISEFSRPVQKAYWINFYNALTVQVILQNYPLASIKEIKSGWFSAGPWDLKLVKVAGEEVTLNDIEHRILRPIWQDNRIHYALNCASLSCPELQPEPFTAENSEALLDFSARRYINHPRGVRLEAGNLVLAKLYDWYQVDFGDSLDDVLAHLQSYAAPRLKGQLGSFSGDVSYEYDWNLNELKND